MGFIETQPWGNTEIKFIPRQFSREEIKRATQTVTPDFQIPEDTFVVVDTEEDHTIAHIPGGIRPGIFGAHGTSYHSLVEAMSKARNFLKNQYFPGGGLKDPIDRVKQTAPDPSP